MNRAVVVIHGGCDAPKFLKTEDEFINRQVLREALLAAFEILKKNGSCVDAVCEAIKVMEDSTCFNAGKTAVYNKNGEIELDAGIVNGATGKAGGVTNVSCVKNPILLAEKVMSHSPHTLLAGSGATEFAQQHKLETVNKEYFWSEERLQELQYVLHQSGGKPAVLLPDEYRPLTVTDTIGAVALDLHGNLAAGNSTGGLIGKLPGRVSDAAVVGAGFWADKNLAISGTGDGDQFLRSVACYAAASAAKSEGLNAGCKKILDEQLANVPAGFIAVDKSGNVAMPYNTTGMFRGYIKDYDADPCVYIWDK